MSAKKISVVSLDQEEGKKFIKEACSIPSPAESGFTSIGDSKLRLNLGPAEDPQSIAAESDIALLLVHFMDIITVKKLTQIYHELEKSPDLETVVVLYKPKDEASFKISCRECGQKVWVPDKKEGVKAKCPKCDNSFKIMNREDHARTVLGLGEAVSVKTVEESDTDSFRQVLEAVVNPSRANTKKTQIKKSKPKIRIKKKN